MRKVLMYQFHYDYIKNKYCNNSRLLLTDTDLTLSFLNERSNRWCCYETFVGLKPKMYSFLVDDNSEHKKAKEVIKNAAVTITHNEYKNLFSQ